MISRRKFLQGSVSVFGSAFLTGFYTFQVEPYWVEFVRHLLPIRHLPAHLHGRKLVQLSDLHVGNRFDWQYMVDAMKRAQALDPDFVVYTGDFVSYDTAEQLDQLQLVMKHAVRGRQGTFAVLGNHDYGVGWRQTAVADAIVTRLRNAGISVLRNEIVTAGGLTLAGLDEYWSPNYAPELVLPALDAQQANLVLCHNPDVADQPVWHGYQGWILCGHTHGGQVKPPFLPPPALPVVNKRYTAGKIDLADGRFLYINRALGNLWPVRFNVRPEVTVFTLLAA